MQRSSQIKWQRGQREGDLNTGANEYLDAEIVETTLIVSRFRFLKSDLGYPSSGVIIKILNLSLISSSIARIDRERLFRAPESHFLDVAKESYCVHGAMVGNL